MAEEESSTAAAPAAAPDEDQPVRVPEPTRKQLAQAEKDAADAEEARRAAYDASSLAAYKIANTPGGIPGEE